MLILNRNIGESIHIGDDVRLTVIDVNNDQVRIGIHAPREIPVHREEIYYRIKHQQDAVQQEGSNAEQDRPRPNPPSTVSNFRSHKTPSSAPSHRRYPMCWTKTQGVA